MKNYLSLTLLLLFLSGIPTYGKDKSANEVLAAFVHNINTFNHLYPQEKVYLHFDNTGYYLGETIWFKAYVSVAETNRPTNLSKVLYTELLTPDGDVLETKKYKIENGQANGDFVVRDSLYAGFYEIRAYTRCMLNFGEEVVFSRVFPVFDNPKVSGDYAAKRMTVRDKDMRVPYVREKAPKYNSLNIGFFPEGGNLIARLNNRVAFKATGKDGQSIDVSGTIYSHSGKEVTTFSSQHLGMGAFELVPEVADKLYYAKVICAGKEYKVDLPQAVSAGYSLRINNLHPADMMIQIEKTSDIEPQVLGISIACRGKVCAFNTFSMDESGKYTMRIPKEGFPAGVTQITLFTPEGEVLAERLAFINRGEEVVSVKADVKQDKLDPHTPIEINFEVKDKKDNPVETTFSLAVRDENSLTETYYTEDIRTNLLLSSDLKGYIENPAYYFEADDNKRRAALDLLMMVQGWRRYEWKRMAGIEPFEVRYRIEPALMIEGHVSSIMKKNRQEDIDVKMWMMNLNQGKAQRGECTTNKEGKFNFALGDIYGKWELNLETLEKGKPKHLNIILDRNINLLAKHIGFHEATLPEIQESKDREKKQKELIKATTIPKGWKNEKLDKKEMEDSVKSYLLKEVVITEKKKYKIEDMGVRYANISYDVVSEVDKIIDDNEYFSENLTDFLFRTNPYFSFSGEINRTTYKGKRTMFLVDNTLIYKTAWRSLDNIYVSDVERIMISEVDNLHTLFASAEDLGIDRLDDRQAKYPISKDHVVIFIYTNKDGKPRREPRGTRKTYYTGYSHPRQFYNPDYSYGTLPAEKDFRRTLYWNPDVQTDSRGKASVSFFNSSACKEIDISAEGLTDKGTPMLLESTDM